MKNTNTFPIYHTTGLSIGYKTGKNVQVVAKNINFSLEKGNFAALLGKNGIGKSTLLRTLSKIQHPLSGDIILKGISLKETSTDSISKLVGMVTTERIPDSNLTVYELIALGRQPYTNWVGTLTDKDKEHIEAAIKTTNVSDLVLKPCYQLSDGQLQKVMIARVLAQDTEIIILDEPTAHLDLHHKIEVLNLLQTLVMQFGKTVIISTHEVQLALQIATELWLMNDDGFVSGKTRDLIENRKISELFDSPYIQFDLSSRNFIFT